MCIQKFCVFFYCLQYSTMWLLHKIAVRINELYKKEILSTKEPILSENIIITILPPYSVIIHKNLFIRLLVYQLPNSLIKKCFNLYFRQKRKSNFNVLSHD